MIKHILVYVYSGEKNLYNIEIEYIVFVLFTPNIRNVVLFFIFFHVAFEFHFFSWLCNNLPINIFPFFFVYRLPPVSFPRRIIIVYFYSFFINSCVWIDCDVIFDAINVLQTLASLSSFCFFCCFPFFICSHRHLFLLFWAHWAEISFLSKRLFFLSAGNYFTFLIKFIAKGKVSRYDDVASSYFFLIFQENQKETFNILLSLYYSLFTV